MKPPVKIEVDNNSVHVRIHDRISDALRVVVGFDTFERPFVVIQREMSTGYGIQVEIDGQKVMNRV